MVHYNSREKAVLLTLSKCKNVKNLRKCIASDIEKIVSHICSNILNGTIPINSHHYKQLEKHKLVVDKLANNKTKNKLKLIEQRGGFIQFLIPLIASLL
jgi:DNA-binding transcriptional ArsR family regulator